MASKQLSMETPDLHPIVDRSTIATVIASVALDNGLGEHVDDLIRQCAQESAFNVAAHNKKSDCYGLFQLAAATAKELGVNRYDWRDNIVGGVKYMAYLLRYWDGDYPKALASFNWGMGHVRKVVDKHGSRWRDNLPAETTDYLKKILR